MDSAYSPQNLAERMVAIGRFVLAAFSLLAIWLDPSTPTRYQTLTYSLLAGYVVYALAALAITWRARFTSRRSVLASHVFDLAIFSIFIHLTEGPVSPFYVYFVFSLFCAMLRFRYQGVVLTAAAAMTIYLGMGAYAGFGGDPGFELNRFIIRSVYLGVLASLLVYLSIYQHRLGLELSGLAAWPRTVASSLEELLGEVMQRVCSVLRVPSALLIWEEAEEPWLHLVHCTEGRIRTSREAPTRYFPIVAEELSAASFVSGDAGTADGVAMDPGGTIRSWKGQMIDEALRKDYGIRSVIALKLDGESGQGWLFGLGRREVNQDDLVLGRIVARLLTASLDEYSFVAEARHAATSEERLRLSRDLHDGLLQSLTGIALQLQAVRTQMADDPDRALSQIAEIQGVIEDDQADLRATVSQLRPSEPNRPERSALPERLSALRDRFSLGWGMHVEVSLSGEADATHERDVYRIVNEALANAARHGEAKSARVAVAAKDGEIRITVADDGHGFPFSGRYDLADLRQMKRGPKTLKERVTALGGDLVVESSSRGSTIEARIPISGKELIHGNNPGAGR